MAAYKRELTIDAYLLDLTKSLCAAFIVRSSACTANDIFDRELDAGVGQSDQSATVFGI
jgi:4-hydroxybenzoate polyprenyltransferase